MKKIKIKQKKIEEDANIIWNKFIEFSYRAIEYNSSLSEIQKTAVLCFWYYSEMCSSGHSGYFDCHSDINPQDLLKAIRAIGATRCEENFKAALQKGNADNYQETDELFYKMESEYLNLLQIYLNENISEFFEII